MQKALTGIVLLFTTICAHGQQWKYDSPPNTYFTGGKVGIGTITPLYPLHVVGQIQAEVSNDVAFSTKSNLGVVIQQGNIGNDVVYADKYLSIFAHNLQFNGTNWIRRNQYGNCWSTVMNQNYYDVIYAPSNSGGPANSVVTPTTYMRVSLDGRVGIGTVNLADANYKLFVETGIRTRRITVDLATWPDYVFKPDYFLPSLPSVAAYIKANHHLPGMPSADSVAKNGVDLGNNQAQLLEKVEQLTLYAIDLEKQVEDLQKQAEQLRAANEKFAGLQRQIDELKKKIQ